MTDETGSAGFSFVITPRSGVTTSDKSRYRIAIKPSRMDRKIDRIHAELVLRRIPDQKAKRNQ